MAQLVDRLLITLEIRSLISPIGKIVLINWWRKDKKREKEAGNGSSFKNFSKLIQSKLKSLILQFLSHHSKQPFSLRPSAAHADNIGVIPGNRFGSQISPDLGHRRSWSIGSSGTFDWSWWGLRIAESSTPSPRSGRPPAPPEIVEKKIWPTNHHCLPLLRDYVTDAQKLFVAIIHLPFI